MAIEIVHPRRRVVLLADPKNPFNRPIPFRQSLPSPHQSIQWWIDRTSGYGELVATACEPIRIVYQGAPGDLIDAGCGFAKLIGPWQPGSKRVDSDGDSACVEKLKGKSKGLIRFTRRKLIESAIGLPGVTRDSVDWYLAHYRREWREWKQWSDASRARSAATEKSTPVPEGRLKSPGPDDYLKAAAVYLKNFDELAANFSSQLAVGIGRHLEAMENLLDQERQRFAGELQKPPFLRLVVDNTAQP